MKKSKIFEPSSQIPPIHVHPMSKKKSAPEGTLRNHHNAGGHTGTMDDVKRSSHPEPHHLPTDIVGN
jgi:hypothetical protein